MGKTSLNRRNEKENKFQSAKRDARPGVGLDA